MMPDRSLAEARFRVDPNVVDWSRMAGCNGPIGSNMDRDYVVDWVLRNLHIPPPRKNIDLLEATTRDRTLRKARFEWDPIQGLREFGNG